MGTLLYIGIILSLTAFTYEIISLVYNVPDTRVEKKINRLRRRTKEVKTEKDNALLLRFFVPMFKYLHTNIKGLRYNEFKIRSDMEKVGIKGSPEVYMASGFFYAFIAAATAIVLGLATGGKIFWILGFLFAFLFPFYPKSNLRGKVNKLNDELLKEFPNFVSALRYQYGKGKTLNDIVQSYIEVSGPALKYDLQKLGAELEMMSDSEALLRFGDRVGLADVSNFASALVYGQMYGMDIESIFAIQEQEMRRLTRDNIRKVVKRKPIALTFALALPIFNILIIIGAPPLLNMVKVMEKFY